MHSYTKSHATCHLALMVTNNAD